jgi:hypothetical protein
MLTKEQLNQMRKDFREYEKERGFIIEEDTLEFINEIQPEDRKIKYFNHFRCVIIPIVKKFKKYSHPPFPNIIHEEYIYDKNDLKYILEHSENPYLEYEQLKDFDTFAVKIYINIHKNI